MTVVLYCGEGFPEYGWRTGRVVVLVLHSTYADDHNGSTAGVVFPECAQDVYRTDY